MNFGRKEKELLTKNLGVFANLGKNNLGIEKRPNFVTPNFFAVNVVEFIALEIRCFP